MRYFALCALFAAAMLGGAESASAQSIPEGQSCGGLLCDMGVFGHKTEPAASEAKPAAAPTQAVTQKAEVAPEPIEPEPKKRTVRKKKHIAKAATPAPVKSAATEPAAMPEPAKPAIPAAPAPKPVQAATPVASPAQATAAKSAPAGKDALLNPNAGAPPPAFQFRPIY